MTMKAELVLLKSLFLSLIKVKTVSKEFIRKLQKWRKWEFQIS